MKKLLFILLLFSAVNCKAQVGLILTGQSFTDTSDSITISKMFVIPDFSFDGINTITIRLYSCVSPYKASIQQPIRGTFNIPYYNFQITGITYPITKATIFIPSITYLQAQGFTVTTF